MDKELILEVRQLNQYIKEMMDADALLGNVCIRGELSNYKKYPSGHHYFTLKDGESSLKCVMFRSSAMRLRFRPENGMMVLAAGRITVYPRDGVYQLYCVSMRPEGAGDLSVAFEQLKQKLSGEGLFDPAHKKPIPKFPHKIAIITSSAGAALQDMLRIIGHRYPVCDVVLLPVRVQGTEAPGEIAAAIDYANHYRVADLIITGRGGGSMEDLWAFNEEIVARAIYRSEIPVISAVGHEPDVTISDYVADLRAATPSNGAELATPDREELFGVLDNYNNSMAIIMQKKLSFLRQQLEMRTSARVLRSPTGYVEERQMTLDGLRDRLSKAMSLRIVTERGVYERLQRQLPAAYRLGKQKKESELGRLAARLDAMSPLKVLSRGYSITENHRGQAVISACDLKPGDHITIRFHQGRAFATVDGLEETQ